MKQLIFCTIVVMQALSGHGQFLFSNYSDGLAYDDTTIGRLTHMADSLNARFRKTGFNKQYYSAPEGIANRVHLTTGDIDAALHDIKKGISYADFVCRHPDADTATRLLLTETVQKRSSTCSNLYYWIQGPDDLYAPFICVNISKPCDPFAFLSGVSGIQGNWIYNCTAPYGKGLGGLTAFYMVQAPAPKPIPDEYAKMMGYADCLLDTTTEVYYPTARDNEEIRIFSKNTTIGPREAAFTKYFQKDTAHLIQKYGLPASKRIAWSYRDSLLKRYIRDSLATRAEFRQLLADAVQETLSTGAYTNNTFEYCVAVCYSKPAALAMKRNRTVQPSCGHSRGTETRMHEHDIAILASQTGNWPVFLRTRLHMMNDYFGRDLADGRGWVKPAVYVKELEELHINIPDFIIGLSLYAGNAAGRHYAGSAGLLAQACTETTYKKDIEQTLLRMIGDSRLDNYNRLLMRYLFLKYTYLLKSKEERLACLQQLALADKTLPSCIAPRIQINEALFEQGVAGR